MARPASATRAVALLLLLSAGCFGGDANVTETGMGLPVVSAEFPDPVEAGSTHNLEVSVENPGPGDMETVAVAFALIGPKAGDAGFPAPLIGLGVDGESPSIVEVQPSPNGVSADAVVYTFEGIAEGESATYTFRVTVPNEPGIAANSVQVYDGQEIDRAAGIRVETTVER
jgi:hypothetical protein